MSVLAQTLALNGAADLYAALRISGINAEDLADIVNAVDIETAARLRSADQGLLRVILRQAAGLPATPVVQIVKAYLEQVSAAPLFLPALADTPTLALLTQGQHPDMPAFSDRAFDRWFSTKAVRYGLGSYGERRSVYSTDQFADRLSPEKRTIHLGIDVFTNAGTPVYAPLPGRVLHLTYNGDHLDYGHTLILEHDAEGTSFYSLYGHLGSTLPALCHVGSRVEPGQLIAHIGDWHENGGWAPHIHFQVMTDMLEQRDGNFFGVGHPSLWDVWSAICIDPNLILRLPNTAFQV